MWLSNVTNHKIMWRHDFFSLFFSFWFILIYFCSSPKIWRCDFRFFFVQLFNVRKFWPYILLGYTVKFIPRETSSRAHCRNINFDCSSRFISAVFYSCESKIIKKWHIRVKYGRLGISFPVLFLWFFFRFLLDREN